MTNEDNEQQPPKKRASTRSKSSPRAAEKAAEEKDAGSLIIPAVDEKPAEDAKPEQEADDGPKPPDIVVPEAPPLVPVQPPVSSVPLAARSFLAADLIATPTLVGYPSHVLAAGLRLRGIRKKDSVSVAEAVQACEAFLTHSEQPKE